MTPRTSAFVGLSGPIGYAYAHERQKLDNESSSPNAVLENVTGLIICYDDIYFLSRQFCPVDMWDLPYVHFLFEEEGGPEIIDTAIQQAQDLAAVNDLDHGLSFSEFDRITTIMQGHGRLARIDNHTHGIKFGERIISGDANRALNVVTDMLLAQSVSLETGSVDLVISSPAASALTDRTAEGEGIAQRFTNSRIALAQEITLLQTANFLTNLGSYNERYEDLRTHKHIQEFRNFLSSRDVDGNEVSRLAIEVNQLAENYAAKVMSSTYHKNWFKSAGIPALKALGNQVAPFAGTVLGAAAQYVLNREADMEKKAMAWAPFVLDVRR